MIVVFYVATCQTGEWYAAVDFILQIYGFYAKRANIFVFIYKIGLFLYGNNQGDVPNQAHPLE
ncbi:MAG: hypothetical protein IJ928_00270 [Prevotella sp.]|nr:hypothetical protein [Prevotella sp.]